MNLFHELCYEERSAPGKDGVALNNANNPSPGRPLQRVASANAFPRVCKTKILAMCPPFQGLSPPFRRGPTPRYHGRPFSEWRILVS